MKKVICLGFVFGLILLSGCGATETVQRPVGKEAGNKVIIDTKEDLDLTESITDEPIETIVEEPLEDDYPPMEEVNSELGSAIIRTHDYFEGCPYNYVISSIDELEKFDSDYYGICEKSEFISQFPPIDGKFFEKYQILVRIESANSGNVTYKISEIGEENGEPIIVTERVEDFGIGTMDMSTIYLFTMVEKDSTSNGETKGETKDEDKEQGRYKGEIVNETGKILAFICSSTLGRLDTDGGNSQDFYRCVTNGDLIYMYNTTYNATADDGFTVKYTKTLDTNDLKQIKEYVTSNSWNKLYDMISILCDNAEEDEIVCKNSKDIEGADWIIEFNNLAEIEE